MYHFAVAMTKSKVEFGLEYNTKIIDWDSKKSKIITTLPKWRKDKSDPPTQFQSVYAKNINAKLEAGEKLTAASVKKDFDEFLNTTAEDFHRAKIQRLKERKKKTENTSSETQRENSLPSKHTMFKKSKFNAKPKPNTNLRQHGSQRNGKFNSMKNKDTNIQKNKSTPDSAMDTYI
jgi:hypothetical protein